jgi:Flp pilus assembly CpaE family ATPase
MNSENINVLLIEDSPDYAEVVAHWVSSAAAEEHLRLSWVDSLEAGLNRLAESDIDVILLDLGLPDSVGLPTFTAVRNRAPSTPVIILSASDSESLAVQTIQDGAENYLVKGSCTADLLLRAVRYAIVRHRAKLNKASGDSTAPRVLGITGANGGLGASTVAGSLAQELCRQTGQKVLLADLDVQGGSVAFQMGIEPKYTLRDAIANIDQMDSSCLQDIVTQKGKDLAILASPALLGASEPDAESVRRLVDLSRALFRWIVLDLGPLNCFSRAVLNSVDELFVVTTPAIPALYETKRMIDALVQGGLPSDRIRLVVNQAEESQSLSAREVKQMFGVQVRARLPGASEDLREAYVSRRLPAENTKIRKEIARLARYVAGLPEPPSKRGIARFFPFGQRSRTTDESHPVALTP